VTEILPLALAAALNPTLLTATTIMLVLPNPSRLLLGYLCGAMLTSVTLGCVIVFAVGGDSSTTDTAEHTLNPVADLVLGGLILLIAFVVGTGRDTRRRARAERKKAADADKGPPKWKQVLSQGSPRTTFVVGALLTLPGASYLAGLSKIAKQDASTASSVLMIVGFNLVMLILLEVPVIGYAFSPEKTASTVERFTAWLSRNGGRVALIAAVVVGAGLAGRGVVELAS
jgi:Sap, sulfolipid-1-addressing protein